MNPANKKFLDDNRHHHTNLVKAFYLRNLSGEIRDNMQRIMSEEFQPGYRTDLWCGPCCSDMVLALYRNYDNWLAVNPEPISNHPETTLEPPKEELPPERITSPSIIYNVEATFPKHDKETVFYSKEPTDSEKKEIENKYKGRRKKNKQ